MPENLLDFTPRIVLGRSTAIRRATALAFATADSETPAGSLWGRDAHPEETTGMVLDLCLPLAASGTGQTFIVAAVQNPC